MGQRAAWEKEYVDIQGVMSSTSTEPSDDVRHLMEYIAGHHLEVGKRAIDLGCGAGRYAIYLAEHGYDVMAVDFAEPALEKLRLAITGTEYEPRVTVRPADLTQPLPFPDDRFDLAVDMTASTSLDWPHLQAFEQEVRRIVRPGGLLIGVAIADDDGVLRALNPGGHSVTVPASGITDYYRSETQLRRVYGDWEILEISRSQSPGYFYGQEYDRSFIRLLARNKKARSFSPTPPPAAGVSSSIRQIF
jgi:SAM-dependent methyltransferase